MMTAQDSAQNLAGLKPDALIKQIPSMPGNREGKAGAARPVQKIRSIKAIGAVTGKDGALSARDTAILKNTFNALTQSGFVFTPDVTLDIVNLAGRRDYLRESVPADLHVFCFVYGPRLEDKLACFGGDRETLKEMEQASLQNAWKHCAGINEAFFHKQSECHYDSRAWEEAAVRQGAKIIATYGYNRLEINTGDFGARAYAEWIATTEGLSYDTPGQLPESLHSYGVLVRRDLMIKNHSALLCAKQALFNSRGPR